MKLCGYKRRRCQLDDSSYIGPIKFNFQSFVFVDFLYSLSLTTISYFPRRRDKVAAMSTEYPDDFKTTTYLKIAALIVGVLCAWLAFFRFCIHAPPADPKEMKMIEDKLEDIRSGRSGITPERALSSIDSNFYAAIDNYYHEHPELLRNGW
jgi:hypothetical protein